MTDKEKAVIIIDLIEKVTHPRQAATYWQTIHPNQHAKERKSNGNI